YGPLRRIAPEYFFAGISAGFSRWKFSKLRSFNCLGLEARVGIEPTNAAFAEPCLTTWLPRLSAPLNLTSHPARASNCFLLADADERAQLIKLGFLDALNFHQVVHGRIWTPGHDLPGEFLCDARQRNEFFRRRGVEIHRTGWLCLKWPMQRKSSSLWLAV